ncbi:hypothetical protein ACP3TY_13220 [Pseudomonas rustica]|uniref:hypothetical protein n=1 Tax=Pseudomonas rustica TaxID=2827099 RepID=UPI003CFA4EFC
MHKPIGSPLWLWRLSLTFSVLCLAIYRAHVNHQRRNRKRIDEEFSKTIAQRGIENVQIHKDHTRLGYRTKGGKRPFEVHRILHDPPDRWFVYSHTEDSDPVLMPISQQRAVAARG